MTMSIKKSSGEGRRPADKGIHLGDEDLAFYVDALRNGKEKQLPAEVLGHVEGCLLCQGKILDIHVYLHDVPALSASSPRQTPFPGKKPTAPAWLPLAGRLAASFIAVVLLAGVFLLLQRDHSPHAPAVPVVKSGASPSQAVVRVGNQDALPSHSPPASPGSGRKQRPPATGKSDFQKETDAFAINPNLEFMIDSRSRSFTVSVHSPANNSTLTGRILFSWREFGSEPLRLVIVSNRNEAVFASPVRDSQFLFSQRLPPGCYYWKLESANELYHVGKFFIAAEARSPKE
jgi:hypothetical protein